MSFRPRVAGSSSARNALRRFAIALNPLVLLSVGFGVSRIAFYAAGVRYYFQGGYQILDLHLLGKNLLSNIWHLHMQPPLYNMFIGVVLALPGAAEKPFMVGCWLLV